MLILFLNNKIQNCGVYQYGYRIYNIFKKSINNNYVYEEIENFDEYTQAISRHNPTAIIYNYHILTMTWLHLHNINKEHINIGIVHESNDTFFDVLFNINPVSVEQKNSISIPRPIYENIADIKENYVVDNIDIKDFIDYNEGPEVPIFGSFGFGFLNKGFDKIVELINENYEKAIIKLIITFAHFNPSREEYMNTINTLCHSANKNPKIKLLITHQFFSNEEILLFLESNTANIFLYDKTEGRSISSVIDYAISANKPILISDSCMFRHIYSDDICIYKTNISEAINNCKERLPSFLDKNSNINLINKVDDAISTIENNVSFELLSAYYTSTHYKEKTVYCDVTIPLKRLYYSYVLNKNKGNDSFVVSNDIFGDTCVGLEKCLLLNFKISGKTIDVIFKEGEEFFWDTFLQSLDNLKKNELFINNRLTCR